MGDRVFSRLTQFDDQRHLVTTGTLLQPGGHHAGQEKNTRPRQYGQAEESGS
jgi:hypothetical protein